MNYIPLKSDDNDEAHYSLGVNDEEVDLLANIDAEVDEFITHLNESTTIRGLNLENNIQQSSSTAEIIAIGVFENGERVLFSKHYKAYVFDENNGNVQEVSVSELSPGDSIVFTQKNSETRDVVENILSRLVNENKINDNTIITDYRKSKYWKKVLHDYMERNHNSASEIVSMMITNGVQVQDATIKGWLDEDSHTVGPRKIDSILQIARLVEDKNLYDNANEYYEACNKIRKIRKDILKQIGKVINAKLSGKKPDANNLTAEIYERVDSIALVLRLESITTVNQTVPINMINRPINI